MLHVINSLILSGYKLYDWSLYCTRSKDECRNVLHYVNISGTFHKLVNYELLQKIFRWRMLFFILTLCK